MEPDRVAGDRGVQGLPGVGLADPLQGAEGRTDHRQVGGVGQQRLVGGRPVVQVDAADPGPEGVLGQAGSPVSKVNRADHPGLPRDHGHLFRFRISRVSYVGGLLLMLGTAFGDVE